MNILREWQRAKPEFGRGRFTLDDLISDFIGRRTDPRSPLMKNRDDVVDWCMEAIALREAIDRAVASRRPNGKLHNHQSRVPLKARQRLGLWLTRDIAWLRRVKTFEELHERIVWYGIVGIGPVTAYDVATRVGAYLGLAPRYIHLHAGCRAGLLALRASGTWEYAAAGLRVGEYVHPKELPAALDRRLTPDEIEDFLCVYREVLDRVRED